MIICHVWAIQAKLFPPEYNYHNYIFRKRGLVAVYTARRGAEELVPGEQNQEGVVSWQSTVWINIFVRLPCLFLLITRLATKERLRLSIAKRGRSNWVLAISTHYIFHRWKTQYCAQYQHNNTRSILLWLTLLRHYYPTTPLTE